MKRTLYIVFLAFLFVMTSAQLWDQLKAQKMTGKVVRELVTDAAKTYNQEKRNRTNMEHNIREVLSVTGNKGKNAEVLVEVSESAGHYVIDQTKQLVDRVNVSKLSDLNIVQINLTNIFDSQRYFWA